jgi:hypothetical protein
MPRRAPRLVHGPQNVQELTTNRRIRLKRQTEEFPLKALCGAVNGQAQQVGLD